MSLRTLRGKIIVGLAKWFYVLKIIRGEDLLLVVNDVQMMERVERDLKGEKGDGDTRI